MGPSQYILVSALFAVCASQRPTYAGRRPIGYPIIETTTVATATAQNDTLGNRFDDNSTLATNITTTTQRLPVEALGDRDLVNRLGKLPQDKQPFWYINWQALDANRKQPQSYPLRPNSFVDSVTFPENTQQPIQNSQSFLNTQQPLQNNQGFINPQQPLLSNQGFPNRQQPLQNSQGFLNSQQPFQNNPGLSNTQQPVQSNQGFLNNQRPFENQRSFRNSPVFLSNSQPRFSGVDLTEDSEEFY